MTRARHYVRMRAARRAACVLVVAVAAAAPALGSSTTESSVVTAEVLSATNLDVAAGCASGTSDVTAFGELMPGTSNVTGSDCTVVFGSSNDTSMLRMYQSDGIGTGMYSFTDGTTDSGFGTNGATMIDWGPGDGQWAYQESAVLLPNGQILIGGLHNPGGTNAAFVARLDSDGSLDGSFGTGGYVSIDVPTATATTGYTMTVDSSGRILVGGMPPCQVPAMTCSLLDACRMVRLTRISMTTAT